LKESWPLSRSAQEGVCGMQISCRQRCIHSGLRLCRVVLRRRRRKPGGSWRPPRRRCARRTRRRRSSWTRTRPSRCLFWQPARPAPLCARHHSL
jgi:hypothetical protein